VDWDAGSGRGKHDGNHNGKRYFTARQDQSASFVREKKLSVGQSLGQAARERYGASVEVDQNELDGLRCHPLAIVKVKTLSL